MKLRPISRVTATTLFFTCAFGLVGVACGGTGTSSDDVTDSSGSGSSTSSTGGSGSGGSGATGTGATSGTGGGSGTTGGGSSTVDNEVESCESVIAGSLTGCADTNEADPNFSFFVASRVSMVALSGNSLGFGGNLGGLECADQICSLIAECVAPSNGKTWHAFLSTSDADAKDRVGAGPWYDVLGNKIADNVSGLLQDRPTTSEGTENNNLPNEFGCANLTPACDGVKEDNHHVMTGSTAAGTYQSGRTCDDWTSESSSTSGPAVGLSWIRSLWTGNAGGGDATAWLNYENESGCAPGGNLTNNPPQGNNDGTVGSGGGYGAIYCMAVVE